MIHLYRRTRLLFTECPVCAKPPLWRTLLGRRRYRGHSVFCRWTR